MIGLLATELLIFYSHHSVQRCRRQSLTQNVYTENCKHVMTELLSGCLLCAWPSYQICRHSDQEGTHCAVDDLPGPLFALLCLFTSNLLLHLCKLFGAHSLPLCIFTGNPLLSLGVFTRNPRHSFCILVRILLCPVLCLQVLKSTLLLPFCLCTEKCLELLPFHLQNKLFPLQFFTSCPLRLQPLQLLTNNLLCFLAQLPFDPR